MIGSYPRITWVLAAATQLSAKLSGLDAYYAPTGPSLTSKPTRRIYLLMKVRHLDHEASPCHEILRLTSRGGDMETCVYRQWVRNAWNWNKRAYKSSFQDGGFLCWLLHATI
ncbi:hypothetical protein K504DRAFT_36180 [Pleomassaria siparia CBS 279.74]|uniref:Uncharacterized protein n=1 Tax=Pleomassaria siparia CBS 279.74 TaxID=1314801 RepID=A0A6G1K4C8_9PLEO|nr:hypothetical protein K504DRAFT_36180 [Pleomassaria siparia CBS 279.74]